MRASAVAVAGRKRTAAGLLMRGMTEMAVKRYSNENYVRSERLSVIFAVIFYYFLIHRQIGDRNRLTA